MGLVLTDFRGGVVPLKVGQLSKGRGLCLEQACMPTPHRTVSDDNIQSLIPRHEGAKIAPWFYPQTYSVSRAHMKCPPGWTKPCSLPLFCSSNRLHRMLKHVTMRERNCRPNGGSKQQVE